ncbi:MAG: phosphotransferase [Chloroflexi bacterium]|nr:phosphotransferase [Chloroflexota bacterium]
MRQYGSWHQGDRQHPVVFESAVLRVLAETNVPAPRLVLGEPTSKILGRPGIVTTLVDGAPKVKPNGNEKWVKILVGAIAKVHELELGPTLNGLLPSSFEGWDRTLGAPSPPAHVSQHPLGYELWSRLKRQWPSVDKSARSLIHNDYWCGNTLWKHDELVAIVDWEEPRIGEPTCDIANLIQDAAVTGIDIERQVLDVYGRVSIRPLRDYTFWRMASALGEMPDPGEWAELFPSMTGESVSADQFRANHTSSIEKLLGES